MNWTGLRTIPDAIQTRRMAVIHTMTVDGTLDRDIALTVDMGQFPALDQVLILCPLHTEQVGDVEYQHWDCWGLKENEKPN